MDKKLIQAFWNCGDDQIIQFAILRAHLNRCEQEVLKLMLDDCRTQEECAEILHYSVRHIQDVWHSAIYKLINIPWLKAYAKSLLD